MNRKKIVALIAATVISFNSLSSISNVKVFANSIENLQLVMEEEIPQSQMTAEATSAQSGEEGSKAIDGNLSTMWHTPWNGSATLPQSLTIDLGGVNKVSSVKVSPRTSQTNGIITKYEVYAINGAEEALVATGNWKLDNNAKTISFETPVNAEKIKITAVEAGGGFASIAEVNIYRVKENVEKVGNYQNKKITNDQGVDISSDVDALKNLEEGTIIARFDSTKSGIQSLISVGNSKVANGHFHLYVNDNEIGFEIRNQSGNVTSSKKVGVVLNKGINTVALKVEKGVGYKIFANGKLAAEYADVNATLTAQVVDIDNAYIGRTKRSSGNEYTFGGYIDFVDVYGDAVPDKYLYDITGQTVLPAEEEILPEGMKSEPIDLFAPGDLGSPNFRIPALFTTKDGTVIASIDVRNNGGHDAPGNNIDAAIRRKPLNGEWEDAQVVIDLPSKAAVIDTALTQDEETGRLFLLVTTFAEGYGFPNVQQGSGYTEIDGVRYRSLYNASGELYTIREGGNVYDSEGNITNYKVDLSNMNLTKDGVAAGNVMTSACELKIPGTSFLSLIHSDDDGVTWSDPVDVTGQVKADWMKFLGTGPGAGMQIKNGEHKGRIVFPVYYTNPSNIQSSAVIYSDDNGQTWEMGESPNDGRDLGNGQFSDSQTMTGGLQLTECQVVEMPNGQLKLFSRNTGSYVRIATSFDGGATWDSEVYEDTNLPEPYCQLSVINYSQKVDGKDAIVFANPKGGGRANGTVRFGLITENGTHANGEPRYELEWKYNKLVKAGAFAYSCLTELPNGDIGLFYEGTGSQEMSYMEMSPEYIKFNYEESVEELVNPAEISSVEVLGDKESYVAGDNISVKLTFDQAVSLMGDKNITLKIGESEVALNVVSEENSREFVFSGKLPVGVEEGTHSLILKANENTEILNTVAKNVVLNSDIDLSEIGGQITVGVEETPETPGETPEVTKPLAGYSNMRISNNNAVDISADLNSFKDLTEGTIIARFDNANKTGVQSIIGIGNDEDRNSHFHLYTFGDKVGFELRNQTESGATEAGTTNIARPSANVTLNEGINTIAFKVTNGEGYKIFVNGVLTINVEDTNARFLDAVEGINKAYIGKAPRHTSATNMYPFNGDVDFVEIYGTTLEDEALLAKTAETTLVSDLATAVSSVEILEEKEEYVAGDKVSFKVTFNQAVSLVGETDLALKVGEIEVPVTLVKGNSTTEFVFEGVLPEGITTGSHDLVVKANENTAILNTSGNNITLSSDMELNKTITIVGETPEVEAGKLILTMAQEITVGNEFEVKVNVANLEDKYAADFEVEYDNTKAEFKSATSVVEGKYFVQSKVSEGKVRVIVASFGTPIDNAIDFVKLVFEAKEAGENVTFNTINSTVSNGEGEVLELENGTASTTIKVGVDKSGLTTVIETAKGIIANDSDKYTKETIDVLKESIALAEGVVANETATQEQVDVAKEALQAAIDGLEEKGETPEVVDKTALRITIEYADELVVNGELEGVVPAVVKEFNEKLATAKEVYNNASATVAEVKTAFDDLTTVIQMLEFKQGDKSALKNLIDSVGALDKNIYTEESWTALEAVLTHANAVFANENAMQAEVDETTGRLQEAIEDLELKQAVVNKSVLQNLVDKVGATDSSKYIASTWKPFADALTAANSVLSNADATQEEVDSAYNALLRAYLNLRLTPDKSLLEGLIKEIQSLDLSNYTSKSVKNLEKELAKANKVLNNEESTQKEVDLALASLEEAKNSLVASAGSNNNSSSSSSANKGNGSSNSGKLPNTGTAGVAGVLMSGALSVLVGLGLYKKRK